MNFKGHIYMLFTFWTPAAVTSNAKKASGQGAEALKNVISKGWLGDVQLAYKSTTNHVLLMQAECLTVLSNYQVKPQAGLSVVYWCLIQSGQCSSCVSFSLCRWKGEEGGAAECGYQCEPVLWATAVEDE